MQLVARNQSRSTRTPLYSVLAPYRAPSSSRTLAVLIRTGLFTSLPPSRVPTTFLDPKHIMCSLLLQGADDVMTSNAIRGIRRKKSSLSEVKVAVLGAPAVGKSGQ